MDRIARGVCLRENHLVSGHRGRSWFLMPNDSAQPSRTTWKMLPLVLALAFLVRAALGLTTQAIVHPDAIFQYLEQGHRLAFGNGIIPWEYVYGIRSWI